MAPRRQVLAQEGPVKVRKISVVAPMELWLGNSWNIQWGICKDQSKITKIDIYIYIYIFILVILDWLYIYIYTLKIYHIHVPRSSPQWRVYIIK